MQEDYVTLETAKLLKEKGFDISVSRYYNADGAIIVNFEESNGEAEYYFDADSFNENWNDGRVIDKNNMSCWGCGIGDKYFEPFSAPTQALVCKWLMQVHKIFIEIHACYDYHFQYAIGNWRRYEPEKTIRTGYVVLGETFFDTYSKEFPSPEETTEQAIVYILNNLLP